MTECPRWCQGPGTKAREVWRGSLLLEAGPPEPPSQRPRTGAHTLALPGDESSRRGACEKRKGALDFQNVSIKLIVKEA